jgi:hypothetical protein
LCKPEGQAIEVAKVVYLLVRSAVEAPSDDGLDAAARVPVAVLLQPVPESHIENCPIFLVRELVTLARLDGHTTICLTIGAKDSLSSMSRPVVGS